MLGSKIVGRLGISYLVSVGLVGLLAAPAMAVIIRSGNISAPADDPGWDNVGKRGTSSAVYLESRWVLTAAHVGPGSVTFDGTGYGMVPGSWNRLHEPGNESALVDLGLFRIDSVPPLVSDLTVSNSVPPNTSDVVAIGYGRNRATTETTWYVDTDPDPWVWQESTFLEFNVNRYGYKYASGDTKRWGLNDVDASGYTIHAGYGDTYTIEMDFDRTLGHGNDEMQVATHDSGGGLFYKNGGDWELAGTLMAKGGYSGQPSDTAVYDNQSHAADLSRYRDQIMALVVPEPCAFVLAMLGLLGLGLFRSWRRVQS